MSADVEAVRHAYFHPPPEGPFRDIPTHEEQLAEGERKLVRLCIDAGGDPVAEGLGEHGALIGGPERPMRLLTGSRPLEDYARPRLAPAAWFNNPQGRAKSGRRDPDHQRMRAAIASHMAGTPAESRPTPAQLYQSFVTERPDEMQRFWLHAVISCASIRELREMMFHEGLSRHDLVRAIHSAGAVRHGLARWLNQFASRPP